MEERSDVRLTFDDSYRSDIDIVVPELQSRGLVGTFFVVVGRLDQPDFIAAADVREIAATGMIVGSHGMRHRPWRRLTDEELDEELVRARAMLHDLSGTAVDEAACPFGAYDRRTVRGLKRAGYRHVFTSDGGWARQQQWMQARNTLARDAPPDVIDALAAGGLPERPHPLQPLKNLIKRWR